jgi:cell division septation protein DedD
VDREEAALPKSRSKRFTDEQIFDLLRAAEGEGVEKSALCEASGITVPTYCLWKARYGKLTLDDLRRARAIESKRAAARRVLVAGGIVVMLAAVGLSVNAWFLPSALVTQPRPATAARRERAPAVPVAPAAPTQSMESPHASAPAGPVPAAGGQPSPGNAGYSVQLAAVPDMPEASEKVEQLASAGYAAYVLPTTAGDLTLYRVRIGPFESLGDAQDVVRRLRRDGYEGAWISK